MDKSGEYSESDLLNAFQLAKPPDWAIRQLYLSYYKMVSSYVLKNDGNEQDAEDIFQDVIISFIEMVQNKKFRAASSISSFLYALTRHMWLNELRRKGRAKRREEKFDHALANTEPGMDNLLVERELRSQLMQMIETLGEACKTILLAYYYDNLPMREILGKLNYQNEQVLRNKKYKCMKQLEEMLSGKITLLQYLKSSLYHE